MRDGVRPEQDLSVDGFLFRPEHEQFTLDVRKVRKLFRTFCDVSLPCLIRYVNNNSMLIQITLSMVTQKEI